MKTSEPCKQDSEEKIEGCREVKWENDRRFEKLNGLKSGETLGQREPEQQAFTLSPQETGSPDAQQPTSPKAEKRIPLAWNETHEIFFWQEPECDQTPAGQGRGGKQRKSL